MDSIFWIVSASFAILHLLWSDCISTSPACISEQLAPQNCEEERVWVEDSQAAATDWVSKLWQAKSKTNSQFLEELVAMTPSVLIGTHNTVHHQGHELSLPHSSRRAFQAGNLYKTSLFFSLASVPFAFCFPCWALYDCYEGLFPYWRRLIYISSKALILALHLLWSF